MTRKEVYQKIKLLNLQNKVKEEYGDNYTRIATVSLMNLIKEAEKPLKQSTSNKESKIPYFKIDKLIEVLTNKHILLKSEIDYINK